MDKFTAKLTFLWYNKKPTSLQRNGMAAIPKTEKQDPLEVGFKNMVMTCVGNGQIQPLPNLCRVSKAKSS